MMRLFLTLLVAYGLIPGTNSAIAAVADAMKGVFTEQLNDQSMADKVKGIFNEPLNQQNVADKVKGIFTDSVKKAVADKMSMFSDSFGQYLPALRILKVMKDLMDKYRNPETVANETAKRIPMFATSFALITAACQVPPLRLVPYVGPACLFITQYSFVIMPLIQTMTQRSKGTNCISMVDLARVLSGDSSVQAETILTEITCMIDRDDKSNDIIKTVVTQYGALLDNMDLLTKACQKHEINSDAELQPACEVLGNNLKMFKATYDRYMKEAEAWVQAMADAI